LPATFDRDLEAAARYYQRALRAQPSGEAHQLAARGLGDLERIAGHYRAADRYYREARVGASPVLEAELDNKLELVHKLFVRRLGEWACWLLVVATLAFYLRSSRFWQRPRELELPGEALYVLPVYALLVLGCIGRDAAVLHALILCALWSTALICGAGLAVRRLTAGRRRWPHLLLLSSANVALFYAVCNHAGLLDHLFFTITVG
jgi:hypothetical protein